MIKKSLIDYQKNENSARIFLSLLGVPQLKVDEQSVRLPYLKAEALFYYLAVTSQSHSRAALATLLWGKSPEPQARNSLRNAVYCVRKGLQQANPLIVERDTIGLDTAMVRLDLAQFQTILGQPPDTTTLAKALALWRGPFLDGLHLPDTI
jgi:DNA-binding SARP family transcriptional activator